MKLNENKGFEGVQMTRNIESLNSNRRQTIHTSFSWYVECEISGSAALSSSINRTFTKKTSQYFTFNWDNGVMPWDPWAWMVLAVENTRTSRLLSWILMVGNRLNSRCWSGSWMRTQDTRDFQSVRFTSNNDVAMCGHNKRRQRKNCRPGRSWPGKKCQHCQLWTQLHMRWRQWPWWPTWIFSCGHSSGWLQRLQQLQ